jgi:hypothetical protein
MLKSKPSLPPRLLFAFITAAALLFELSLTRLFSYLYFHHLSSIAVAIALSGLGAGAFLNIIFVWTKVRRGSSPIRFRLWSAVLLGVGFMFIELGLLQKLSLAIGGPSSTLSVVLVGLLGWCGAGSGVANHAGLTIKKRLVFSCFGISVVTFAAILWIQSHYLLSSIASNTWRIIVVLLFLAPIGLFLGIPFPSLLSTAKDRIDLSTLWGINALASVIGAMLYVASSLLLGIEISLLIGVVVYASAAMLFQSQTFLVL